MAFCTSCGSELDPAAKFCPDCGSKVEVVLTPGEQQGFTAQPVPADSVASDPLASQGADAVQSASSNPANPVGADAPSMGGFSVDPLPTPVPVDPSQAFANPAPVYAVPAPNPFLQGWKTDVGMTIAGVVGGMLISMLVSAVQGITGSFFLSGIVQLAYVAAALVYAAAYYPSFFSAEPKLSDPRMVSMLNGLFGGIIFGCLWNASLTKRAKGISYIVCIVLLAFSVLGTIGMIFG